MANYVSDRELYYEIVLSKGMGKLTKNCENMFFLIAENMIRKKEKKYKCVADKEDCINQGLLHLFSNWKSFNEKKFTQALPYISEIFKRGIADGFNQIYNRKSYNKDNIRTISIDSANEGKGLHHI